MTASCELAETLGAYQSYPGSPLSKGVMQPDMWGVTPSAMWDWASLRARVAVHGARNSLLLAPMPTASTAQILGNNESIEPFTSNIYTRRVLAGEVRGATARRVGVFGWAAAPPASIVLLHHHHTQHTNSFTYALLAPRSSRWSTATC